MCNVCKENYIVKIDGVVVFDGGFDETLDYVEENVGDEVWFDGEEISLGDCMETCYVEGENLNIDIFNKFNKEINIMFIIY